MPIFNLKIDSKIYNLHEESRSYGGERLCKQIFDECGLSGFLSREINNDTLEKHIAIEVMARMLHTSSELETGRWFESVSSLCELLSQQTIPERKAVVPHK